MKLFLRRKQKTAKWLKTSAYAVVSLIFLSVVVSQVYMAVCRGEADAVSGNAAAGNEYVELCFDGNTDGSAFVMLDGEKYADIVSEKMNIALNGDAVVEVYNDGGKINVGVSDSSDGIIVVGGKEKIVCEKGIKYICRCISR